MTTRRGFIGSAAAVLAARYVSSAHASRAVQETQSIPGSGTTLDAREKPIDLAIDALAFTVNGRTGHAIAVNGTVYTPDLLKNAVTIAKGSNAPIELLVKKGDRYRSVQFQYHGGLRYPRLERAAGTPARLDQIFQARP